MDGINEHHVFSNWCLSDLTDSMPVQCPAYRKVDIVIPGGWVVNCYFYILNYNNNKTVAQ